MMQFEETPEFKKDFKKLLKKYRSLKDDLTVLKQIINTHHDPSGKMINGFFEIPGLKLPNSRCKFWKIKKIACKSLKGKGGNTKLRIIYAFIEQESKVVFLEFYSKADQNNEDKQRIKSFCKNLI